MIFIPRFCYVALSISQVYLIQAAVGYVQGSDKSGSISNGYGLIGAFAFVYIGLAVSSAIFSLLVSQSYSLNIGDDGMDISSDLPIDDHDTRRTHYSYLRKDVDTPTSQCQ